MELLAIFLLAAAMTQSTLSSDNKPIRAAPFKNIVQHPTVHDVIKSNKESGKIVGGSEVEPHSVPHQAALLVDNEFFCGGSLISDSWVLTSASCVNGRSHALVTLGAHNINQVESTTQYITANAIFVHPDFNSTTLQNDVALLRLPYAAIINKYVSPVCLVPSNITIEDGTMMNATGWGKTADSAPNGTTAVLRTVTVPIISNQDCLVSYGASLITNGTMCTSSSEGKGTCIGDSGGPLTINGKTVNESLSNQQCQAGISSFYSSKGCQNGDPSEYTRVSFHMDWITNKTGIQPCEKCGMPSENAGSRIVNSFLFVLLCVSIAAIF